MLASNLIVAISALLAQPPEETGPKLIAKTNAVLWHAIPIVDHSIGLLPTTTGHLVAFTKLATGDMKIVASDSTTKVVIPMGIDRVRTTRTTIAGIAADKDRVYVLQGTFSTTTLRGIICGPGEVAPVAGGALLPIPGQRLLVFRLSDGSPLHSLALGGDEAMKGPFISPSSGSGPLRLQNDGVACLGVLFEFAEDGSVKTSKADR
ncbi:MAG: hypothetical protein WCL32_18260 [Planctomycetota bacterium]